MAINGRINVDVLFHDTDGTTSLKVVSLEDSTEYTSGKVAIVTGTVGTTAVSLYAADGSGLVNLYKNASGNAVGVINVERIALQASSPVTVDDTDLSLFKLVAGNNRASVCSVAGSASGSIYANAGTASYTVVLYGT